MPQRVPSLERLSTRAFRALLALYPASFRDEYGRELSLVFVDRYRDAAGRWARARLWVEALAGILTEAPKEHARMILADLRDAGRVLRRNTLITATIVMTLGLGIGANTAVFSLLNAIALTSPLPVQHAEELYAVNSGRYVATGPEGARLSGPMFDLLLQTAPQDVRLAAMSRGIARVYTRTAVEREAVTASLQLVSASFFPVLDVSPVMGRLLTGRDGSESSEPVAVLSYAYWQRRFGGSPDVVGSLLVINGASFTIVGIAARDFAGVWLETPVDIWVPLMAQPIVQVLRELHGGRRQPEPAVVAAGGNLVASRCRAGTTGTGDQRHGFVQRESLQPDRTRRRRGAPAVRPRILPHPSAVLDAAHRVDGDGRARAAHGVRERR